MQLYQILNKQTNKSYIGKTKWDFSKRYHYGQWWKWTHSSHLKRAVEKYGLDAFEVNILFDGEVPEAELLEMEKRYIKQFDSMVPNGYNLTEGGGSENPSFVKCYELIDRDGTVYKVKNLSAFCRRNKLSYGAMLSMVAGINVSSQGFALSSSSSQDIKSPNVKGYQLENVKTGELVTIKSRQLKEWCRQRNLSYSKIRTLLEKKSSICGGWKLQGVPLPDDIDIDRERRNRTKYEISLISPEGEEITVDNVYQFAIDRGLDRSPLYDLINQKSFQYRGWTLKGGNTKKIRQDSRNRIWTLRFVKTGEIHTIKNLSRFCRERGLKPQGLFFLVTGHTRVSQGYVLATTDPQTVKMPRTIAYIKIRHEDGRELEAISPRVFEREHKTCSAQMFYDILSGKAPNRVKGWSIVNVRYVDDNYPALTLEPGQLLTI